MNMRPFFRTALLAITAVLVVAAPASAADGQVIALLKDDVDRTKSVVVLRPATL